MGKSLKEIWSHSQQKKGIKVRYLDWDHHTKYFEIEGPSKDQKSLVGKLDNGEDFTFPMISQFWVIYEDEMEHFPKAV